jgi:dephospho-CoA kinase
VSTHRPIIGILGGIGSGKSFVSRLLASHGAMVIDSDELSHSAMSDPAVQRQIRERFGEAVFRADGSVDRRALGQAVFADASDRVALEQIVHPWIEAERSRRMASAGPGVRTFVLDSPLLIESGLVGRCDRLVFVDTPRAVRLERVRARGWDEAELDRRERAQLPLEQKRQRADAVLDGSASAGELAAAVERLIRTWVPGAGGGS